MAWMPYFRPFWWTSPACVKRPIVGRMGADQRRDPGRAGTWRDDPLKSERPGRQSGTTPIVYATQATQLRPPRRSNASSSAIHPVGRRNMLIHKPNVHGLKNHSQFWSIRFDEVWKA